MDSDWISVEDALPVEFVKVLVCNINNQEDDVYIDFFFWEEEEPAWVMRRNGPTHWMPLPLKKVKND